MSGHIVKLHATEHQAAQELLPWFVLDKLDSDEWTRVQEHLQACALCQADVDFQRKLTGLPLPNDTMTDVERAFAKLRPQLKTQSSGVRGNALIAILRNGWRNGNRPWMRWALGAQFATIAGLCVILLQPERGATYHGLGMSGNVVGDIVVTFRPQTTEQELRRILHASGARMVDGPTVTDAYLLNIAVGQQASALRMLRAESAVVFAEPLISKEAN